MRLPHEHQTPVDRDTPIITGAGMFGHDATYRFQQMPAANLVKGLEFGVGDNRGKGPISYFPSEQATNRPWTEKGGKRPRITAEDLLRTLRVKMDWLSRITLKGAKGTDPVILKELFKELQKMCANLKYEVELVLASPDSAFLRKQQEAGVKATVWQQTFHHIPPDKIQAFIRRQLEGQPGGLVTGAELSLPSHAKGIEPMSKRIFPAGHDLYLGPVHDQVGLTQALEAMMAVNLPLKEKQQNHRVRGVYVNGDTQDLNAHYRTSQYTGPHDY